jgi:hypothetical protein
MLSGTKRQPAPPPLSDEERTAVEQAEADELLMKTGLFAPPFAGESVIFGKWRAVLGEQAERYFAQYASPTQRAFAADWFERLKWRERDARR